MNNLKKIVIYIYIFLFLYYPPIVKINMVHIVCVIAYIGLFLNFKNIYKILCKKNVFLICILCFFVLINRFFISYAYSMSIKENIMDSFMWLFEIIPICIFISSYLINNNYSHGDLFDLLIMIGDIQAVFSIISMVYSPFHNWVLSKLMDYGYPITYLQLSTYRLYGVSYSMTFFMPVLQSILAILALFMLEKNRKYFISFILLTFSAVINARTSIVVLGMGLFLLLINFIYEKKGISLRQIVLFIFFSLGMIFGGKILYEKVLIKNNVFMLWIKVGFDAILDFIFHGEKNSYFSYLDSSVFTLPKGLSFLWGTGHTLVRGDEIGIQSDVGYVNYIWTGGIILLVLLFLLFSIMIVKLVRMGDNSVRFLGIFLGLVSVVINIKGIFFALNESTNFIFLIYFFVIIESYSKRSQS